MLTTIDEKRTILTRTQSGSNFLISDERERFQSWLITTRPIERGESTTLDVCHIFASDVELCQAFSMPRSSFRQFGNDQSTLKFVPSLFLPSLLFTKISIHHY